VKYGLSGHIVMKISANRFGNKILKQAKSKKKKKNNSKIGGPKL
jgi:hypothetical protein